LHNLGGAEQRRGPSFCGPTTKRYVDGEDDISEAEQQVIWQRIYGPAVDEHLIAKDNWTKQPGKWRSNRPQPVSAAPRRRQLIAIELTGLFSPGVFWSGLIVNLCGCEVQALQMNWYGVRPLRVLSRLAKL
jgi:hypothetical protein